jgi:hypothetical protein
MFNHKPKTTRFSRIARRMAGLVAPLALLLGTHTANVSATNAIAGEVIYAVTAANRIVSFNSTNTCKLMSNRTIWGLQPNEQILAIDFRPANGQLYALGSSNRLYTLDPHSGQAWPVGNKPFSVTLSGTAFGFDFNPAVDRIRIVSNSGQNLRAHPDTGAIVATDKPLVHNGNPPAKPQVVGAAYTNPDTDPTTPTTLYDIDTFLDLVSTQVPPNDGVLNIVGVLSLNATGLTGFDISKNNIGYAAVLRDSIGTDIDLDWDARTSGTVIAGCGTSRLVAVDLASGKASEIGAIGTRSPIRALAVRLQ